MRLNDRAAWWRFSRHAAFAVAAAGLLVVIFGWVLDWGVVRTVVPGWPSMSPLTALMFTLSGLLIAQLHRARPIWLWRTSALAVSLVGLLTVVGYTLPWLTDVPLNRALLEWLGDTPPGTGHIAPTTGLGFFLLGLALAALFGPRPRVETGQALLLAVGFLSFLALLGFAYDVPGLFGTLALEPMAVHTAALFMLATVATLAAFPERGLFGLAIGEGPGSQLTRRLLLTFLIVPVVLGWISHWGLEAGWYNSQFRLVLMVGGMIAIAFGQIWQSGRLINRKEAERLAALDKAEAHAHELEEANQALQESDRYKDEFLSIISHELRTPLNFVMGFASLLEDDMAGPLNQDQRAYVGKILEGADRMLAQVNNLLDVSRMQAGQFQVSPAPTRFSPIIDEVLESMRPLAKSKHLRLQAETRVPGLIELDASRVAQVLTNLVDNAIKFTPEGGSITVKARQEGDEVLVEVLDTGLGIDEADVPKLFGRFYQVDMSRTRTVGGTGLGLSICKGIVEAHGGTIGVLTQPGRGSNFWFTLPLVPLGSRAAR